VKEKTLFNILEPKGSDLYYTYDYDKIYNFCNSIGYDFVDFYGRDLFDCQCFRTDSEDFHLFFLLQNISSLTEFDPDFSLLVFPQFIKRQTNLRPHMNYLIPEIDLPLIMIKHIILNRVYSVDIKKPFKDINENGKYYFKYI